MRNRMAAFFRAVKIRYQAEYFFWRFLYEQFSGCLRNFPFVTQTTSFLHI